MSERRTNRRGRRGRHLNDAAERLTYGTENERVRAAFALL
jgi:hypothetical protein